MPSEQADSSEGKANEHREGVPRLREVVSPPLLMLE